MNGRPKGGRIKASIHFDAQAIAETDVDPCRRIFVVGHEFNKCPEVCAITHLVLKTPTPMIESARIDPVFSTEPGSGQAAFDLFAYQAPPVCRSFLSGHNGHPFLTGSIQGDHSIGIQATKDGLV